MKFIIDYLISTEGKPNVGSLTIERNMEPNYRVAAKIVASYFNTEMSLISIWSVHETVAFLS